MSRRARKIEKRVSVDPKYNSELIAHIIRGALDTQAVNGRQNARSKYGVKKKGAAPAKK